MAVKVGSNPLSMGVQSWFNKADTTVAKTSERLSSGLRINRGSDDAAGLAISQSLNINAKVYSQGVRNLNDGLSAINVADGAIDGLNTILSRIEELAMQAANGAVSDTQRSVMQQEVTALQAEWNRIVDTTTYNGQQLLTGSTTRMVLQGAAKENGALAVQVGKEALAGGFDNYAGGTSLVSASSAGGQGNGSSTSAFISADGRVLAFSSVASNLVSGDSNLVSDAFVKDALTGVTTRVSTSSSGLQGNGQSFAAAISGDGRYVLFNSDSTNLVTNDLNGQGDVFLKDTSTGVTTRVNTSSSGVQANYHYYGGSFGVAISADGRYVLFDSYSDNLVSVDSISWTREVFVKDTVTGITERVSSASSGDQANGDSNGKGLSADGRYVLFDSFGDNLVSGDNNANVDSFIKDRLTGTTTRVSTSSSGQEAYYGVYGSVISADGRYVAFYSSSSNLVSGDTNGSWDVFLKNTATGVTTRVSTSSSGQQSNGHSYVNSISADGRYVVFHSAASNLVNGDTNGLVDIFIKDTITGSTSRINTSSAGQQATGQHSSQGSISADGRFVTFQTSASNLVSGDGNGTTDIFLRDLTKAGVQTLAGMVVNNKASASVTMSLVQSYRNELIEYRGKLGASSSRVLSYISALDDNRVNLATASSRITDADIASESATLVAANTRRQVASSLLAQANLVPELALALLRNL